MQTMVQTKSGVAIHRFETTVEPPLPPCVLDYCRFPVDYCHVDGEYYVNGERPTSRLWVNVPCGVWVCDRPPASDASRRRDDTVVARSTRSSSAKRKDFSCGCAGTG